MKKIKKILAKMPSDPFEAELLALAGGLVGKKDGEEQFSDDSDYMATDDEDEANDGRGQVSQRNFTSNFSNTLLIPAQVYNLGRPLIHIVLLTKHGEVASVQIVGHQSYQKIIYNR